jgi:hypothetical protein
MTLLLSESEVQGLPSMDEASLPWKGLIET